MESVPIIKKDEEEERKKNEQILKNKQIMYKLVA
jgi:hypothetical protein